MKYQSRVHSVLVIAGFAIALLPATLSAALGLLLAIYALPIIFMAPFLLIPMAAGLWGLVSGWRLFLFFRSGTNEPGVGCWLGVVVFIVVTLSNSLFGARPKNEIPYLSIAVGLHWLWLYWKDFLLGWQRAPAQRDLP
ncbi:hypothetical protein BW686_01505 [Pseudomonas syringae]|uniref:Uncharacterized protein n=1 Tax=Pseudomonas syringae TaxID=317 RepID=A0A244EY29_PSESX|nr:hypothetical protein [Pseudomonas syringae]OUM09394.1 hypothetical protein BW686_01505 [Pseudomonas syringae]